MSRPNRCIKDEQGNDVWVVRSSVVIPIVFKWNQETGEVFTLLEQRGPAVTHTNEWCCPCGYIDWDETLEEACVREVREETGLELSIGGVHLFDVSTDKDTKNQSVDHWYMCWTDGDFDMNKVETKDEILQLGWLKVGKVNKPNPLNRMPASFDIYVDDIYKGLGKWAFREHHLAVIKMLKNYFKNYIITES